MRTAREPLVVPSASDPEIAVIILATRDGHRLERCLRALAGTCPGHRRVQTILCANAVDPDVQEVIDATRGAHVMRSSVNLGTAATWNRAVEATTAPRFAILHEDAAVTPGWLEGLSRALDEDRRAVIAGPRLLWPDGRTQNQGWVQWRDGQVWAIGPDSAPDLGVLRDMTPVDAVSSATMLVERHVWEDVNGFDEGAFPAVTTEMDLCLAAWAAGHRVVTVPSARSVHDTGAMLAADAGWIGSVAFRTFLIHRNLARLGERWGSLLSSRDIVPTKFPNTDAVRGALARTAAAASTPLPRDQWPERSRVITGAGHGEANAPADVEGRAEALLVERQAEFVEWAAKEIDQLYGERSDAHAQLSAFSEALSALDARATAADEATRHAQIAHANALHLADARLAELQARDATLTWRLRDHALRIPGFVAAVQRMRRIRGRGPDDAQ